MHHVEYLNSDKIVYRSKLKFHQFLLIEILIVKIDTSILARHVNSNIEQLVSLDILQNSLCHQFNTSSGLYPLEYLLERGTQLLNQNDEYFGLLKILSYFGKSCYDFSIEERSSIQIILLLSEMSGNHNQRYRALQQ